MKDLWRFRPGTLFEVLACRRCYQALNIRDWWAKLKADPVAHAVHKRSTNARMRGYRLGELTDPGMRRRAACRQIVWIATRGGLLHRQPCESCGAPKSEAHHDDYTKPLEVRWFCRQCHKALHAASLTTPARTAPPPGCRA